MRGGATRPCPRLAPDERAPPADRITNVRIFFYGGKPGWKSKPLIG
jgi:hypothetical protein